MKRILTTCAALAIVGANTSCVDLSEKLVSNLTNEFISTPEGLTAATNAIYNQLRGYYGREQNMAVTDLGTDIFFNGDQVAAGGAQNWEYFNTYISSLNSSDQRLRFLWEPMYVQISRANVVLEQGSQVPVGGTLSQATKDSRLGEAHFFRAMAYFELVQAFGDVTLNMSAVPGGTDAVRAPASEVYNVIIADLDSAIALLPVAQPDWGRVRRGAAQHLLAKVYLTRSYKPYAQPNDAQQALDLANTVINSADYSLVPVYHNLFCGAPLAAFAAKDANRQGLCNTATGSGFSEQNPEILFSVQYSFDTQQYTAGLSNFLHLEYLGHYDNDPGTSVGLTRDLDNGRPFRRLRASPFLISLFDETRWAGTPGASDIMDTRFDGSFQTLWFANTAGNNAADGNGTGNCPAQCTTDAPILVGDTALWMPGYPVSNAFRQTKKFTIIEPYNATNNPCAPIGQPGVDDADCDAGGRTLNKGQRRYGWELFPSLKKYQDNARVGGFNDQEGGKDLILMRLGETYLIAAEAALKLNQPATAAGFIRTLRIRAASPNHKANAAFIDVPPGNITLDFIMDERARELAGELNRWQDLVRPGAQFFRDRVALRNPMARPNIQLFHALRPIPQSQINGVTGTPYPQNNGY
jgi:hypothetical protein